MKKGFTLIELLAVIVILAIIAVIAVPIVLNIIDETKENASLQSADFYLDAVEYTISDAYLNHGGLQDGDYQITKEGNLCKKELSCNEDNILKVEVNGEVPDSGTITITNGKISSINLIYEEKTIVKNSEGKLVYQTEKIIEPGKFNSVCKPVKEQLYATEPLDSGYKYECKVDPNKDAYTFYVLNSTSAEVNLIMDRNICEDGTPTEEGKTCSVAYNSSGDASGTGPVTAMNFLSEATKTWTNTNEMIIDTFTTYSRMPYYGEVSDVSRDKMWLIDYLSGEMDEDFEIEGREHGIDGIYGYWAYDTNGYDAYWVSWEGLLNTDSVDNGSAYGVRPVITLNL